MFLGERFGSLSLSGRVIKKLGMVTGLVGMMGLAGCASLEDSLREKPLLVKVTQENKFLREIPPPKKRIAVAVYRFNDQTGQYKDSGTIQKLSRAVTQGGTSILIKALQDAGERRWFTVLERSQLVNLLKERQILTEMRRLYRGEKSINSRALPPLKHAAILIEGGIVGFSSNLVTGGIGARYLGIGGDVKYSKDEVTVSLRAISTKTGEVLTTVSARKTLVSVGVQAGVFRFIKLDELFEAESGITNNEPSQLAVESAVEKAVQALIIEGAQLGVWRFRDSRAGQDYINAYKLEKYGTSNVRTANVVRRPETRRATYISATVPVRIPEFSKIKVKQRTIKLPPPAGTNSKPLG